MEGEKKRIKEFMTHSNASYVLDDVWAAQVAIMNRHLGYCGYQDPR